jgi:hypothetical protein
MTRMRVLKSSNRKSPRLPASVVAPVAQREVAHRREVDHVGHGAEAVAIDLIAGDDGDGGGCLRERFRVLGDALDGLGLEVVLGLIEEVALLSGGRRTQARRGQDGGGEERPPTPASAH